MHGFYEKIKPEPIHFGDIGGIHKREYSQKIKGGMG